jgi:hypothetical protein
MKAWLTPLRHSGRRIASGALTQARLVSLVLHGEKGFRRIQATCCYGGDVVGQLWEPSLLRFGDQDFVLSGFVREEDAAVVQEWRLRPLSTVSQPFGESPCSLSSKNPMLAV